MLLAGWSRHDILNPCFPPFFQWRMKMRQRGFCFRMVMVRTFLQRLREDWSKGEVWGVTCLWKPGAHLCVCRWCFYVHKTLIIGFWTCLCAAFTWHAGFCSWRNRTRCLGETWSGRWHTAVRSLKRCCISLFTQECIDTFFFTHARTVALEKIGSDKHEARLHMHDACCVYNKPSGFVPASLTLTYKISSWNNSDLSDFDNSFWHMPWGRLLSV